MGWSPFGIFPDILMGKDPTKAIEDAAKTAAVGAGMYFTGGALGSLGGAGAASTAASTVPIAEGVFAGATPAQLLAANGGGASGGLLSGMGSALGTASGYVKPIAEAAGAANSVKGLLGSNSQPMQAPQVMQGNPAGAQTLASLYQQGTQISPEEQARLQRKTMWG